MGRKSKKGCAAPPPTNADWEDATAAFRKEAESAIRARSPHSHSHEDGCAAARLVERHPASPLAHHILGHARASVEARAGDAVPPLHRAAELAPRCPGIAATLASALLYARRPGDALAECARALNVADPTDPALHSTAATASRRAAALRAKTSPQARVAAARERLLGVRADAEALEATGLRHAAAPPPPVGVQTTMPMCCCRHATTRKAVTDDDLRGFLTVNLDDLRSYCDRTGGGVHLLTCAVEFAKATEEWAYWLCPVCDMVFLDANAFLSHVEAEYMDELQELLALMPKRAALDSEVLQYSLKWTPSEMGEEDAERRSNLNTIKNVFCSLDTCKALPLGLMDKIIKFARSRSKKPLPYCIPSCVTSLDSMEIQRLVKPLDQLYNHISRGWEFFRILGNEGKNKGGRSDIMSLVQDGTLLSLDAEKVVASRKKDDSCEEDALFRWLLNSLEEVAIPWASLRQKCVHHGNEVLEKIYGISDLLRRQFDMKCAAKKKNHRGYSLTEVDSIDVEILLLDNEVGYLKSKLVEVCTFDYSAAILPLIRAYIWDKLNNSTGEDSQDGGDKNVVNNGVSLDNLHEESLFEYKIPDTDSDTRFIISRTDECENFSLSQSDSSNFSTLEAESSSIDSGLGSGIHITAEGLLFLNVTLRALWHLREFHDRFLDMPLVLPHLTVEVHCIICLLRNTFRAWDNEKDYGVTNFPHDVGTAFSDILNEHNIFGKERMNIASEIISTILETLHKSHMSLHSYNANIEHQMISTSRCFDVVCIAHNIFGLPIREKKKCICMNESSEKKDYITFFHNVDVSAISVVEMKSLSQHLRDADKQFQFATENCQCGNKTKRSLLSEPPIFAVGTVAGSIAQFARLLHFGCVIINERQSNKLYKISAVVAMFVWSQYEMWLLYNQNKHNDMPTFSSFGPNLPLRGSDNLESWFLRQGNMGTRAS